MMFAGTYSSGKHDLLVGVPSFLMGMPMGFWPSLISSGRHVGQGNWGFFRASISCQVNGANTLFRSAQ